MQPATPAQRTGSPRAPARRMQSMLLALAGAALFASLSLPIWRIQLDAPQYPEGMGMLIWANTITGEGPHDLAIINQLNHYIGMKAIVPESIPELRFIPPIVIALGALCLLAALRPRVWSIATVLAALAVAGTAGMVDFWLWGYDYGHNLDPTAAIKVPGASYQPPLIGTATLLNFQSSSWPAAGGLLLFAGGLFVALALLLAWRQERSARPAGVPAAAASPRLGGLATTAAPLLALVLLAGCARGGPEPFHWGEDACHHCKMTLVQQGFAAQRINEKGKSFKYDAIECLLADLRRSPPGPGERLYVSDLSRAEAPALPAGDAVYLRGEGVSSPMGGGLAAFASADSARGFQAELGGEILSWRELAAP